MLPHISGFTAALGQILFVLHSISGCQLLAPHGKPTARNERGTGGPVSKSGDVTPPPPHAGVAGPQPSGGGPQAGAAPSAGAAPGSSPTMPTTVKPTVTPSPDTSTTPGGLPSVDNPFAATKLFVNPDYAQNVAQTAASAPNAAALGKLQQVSTAFWIDSTARITPLRTYLNAAHQAASSGGKIAVTLVVYNLPDRDCAAKASNGELQLSNNGEFLYRSYIDSIQGVLAQHSDLTIAIILEPDSLGNIVTNIGVTKCHDAQGAYERGVSYAIQTLTALPNVSMYLDAAHSGWLGWPSNRTGFATEVKKVLQMTDGRSAIRGFATNVANYSPLSVPEGATPTWYDTSNPARDELTYVQLLAQDLQKAGVNQVHFVIDTSRNGVIDSRQSWGSWCNIAASGLGVRPIVAPRADIATIDAYLWIKPPGESDGTSDGGATRFDATCAGSDAMTPAPEAGAWFGAYLIHAASKAQPAL